MLTAALTRGPSFHKVSLDVTPFLSPHSLACTYTSTYRVPKPWLSPCTYGLAHDPTPHAAEVHNLGTSYDRSSPRSGAPCIIALAVALESTTHAA